MQLPPDERRGIRHHLLDVLPAHADFSAGDFFDAARSAIADVIQVCFPDMPFSLGGGGGGGGGLIRQLMSWGQSAQHPHGHHCVRIHAGLHIFIQACRGLTQSQKLRIVI